MTHGGDAPADGRSVYSVGELTQGPAEHESRGRAVVWHAAWGGGFGLFYALSMLLTMMLLAGGIMVVGSPLLARDAGTKQGAKELADYAHAPGAAVVRCDSLQASVPFACAHVVVVGKDTLAVYDRDKIYRVQRAGMGLVTAVPPLQKTFQPR